MATYEEMSFRYRLFMKRYPFSRYTIEPVPCATLAKPLNQALAALVTTAGLHIPGQSGFTHSFAGGDFSYREVPTRIETGALIESHKSDAFDHSGIKADRNLAFPLDRFRELVARGEIGGLNYRHFSFMGSITSPRRLIEETAPEVAQKLRSDGVEFAFLTPV